MTDEKCPVCGAVNMYLHLEETGGRYICAVCGSEILVPEYRGKTGGGYECETGNWSSGIAGTAARF